MSGKYLDPIGELDELIFLMACRLARFLKKHLKISPNFLPLFVYVVCFIIFLHTIGWLNDYSFPFWQYLIFALFFLCAQIILRIIYINDNYQACLNDKQEPPIDQRQYFLYLVLLGIFASVIGTLLVSWFFLVVICLAVLAGLGYYLEEAALKI